MRTFKSWLIISTAVLAVTIVSGGTSLAGNNKDKLRVLITSPKPGSEISGTVDILWNVVSKVGKPPYSANYYVDFKPVGYSSSEKPPFKLDTSKFTNDRHFLTINVMDEEKRIGAHSIWVIVKNEKGGEAQ